MYYPNLIEEICYEEAHIQQVLAEIEANFSDYFEGYLKTEAGTRISWEMLQDISTEIGAIQMELEDKIIDDKGKYINIINENITNFERDRDSYLNIMASEALDEHKNDPSNFKNSILRNDCPIIRMTLQNKKAKELDKYRSSFSKSNPNDLLRVVANLTNFAIEFLNTVYDENNYDSITTLEELGFSFLDSEDYSVYGVIGGGIKSHFLYKFNPSVFPNRSRQALWALWYLTGKKTFGCSQDSEFLNINVEKSIIQQNYFYPYELFSFYAYNIYQLLGKEAKKLEVYIDEDYRYVIVDSFLTYIAQEYDEEINFLQSQAREDVYGYY